HPRDADGRRTIACRVGQNGWRFEPRNQALVAIGTRIAERIDGSSVLDDAADIPQCLLREPGVHVSRHDALAALLQRLVYVHAATVVTNQGLGHERRCLAVTGSDLLYHVLEHQDFVGLLEQRTTAHADFALTSSRDFVVVYLHDEPHLL